MRNLFSPRLTYIRDSIVLLFSLRNMCFLGSERKNDFLACPGVGFYCKQVEEKKELVDSTLTCIGIHILCWTLTSAPHPYGELSDSMLKLARHWERFVSHFMVLLRMKQGL